MANGSAELDDSEHQAATRPITDRHDDDEHDVDDLRADALAGRCAIRASSLLVPASWQPPGTYGWAGVCRNCRWPGAADAHWPGAAGTPWARRLRRCAPGGGARPARRAGGVAPSGGGSGGAGGTGGGGGGAVDRPCVVRVHSAVVRPWVNGTGVAGACRGLRAVLVARSSSCSTTPSADSRTGIKRHRAISAPPIARYGIGAGRPGSVSLHVSDRRSESRTPPPRRSCSTRSST